MDDREYFTVQGTSLTIPRSGALAIFAGDKPRKNADGSTSFSLRGPLLLMPQEMWGDADDTMQNVAKVLNENAHLFFDSALKPADLTTAQAQLSEVCGKLHDTMCLPDDASVAVARKWAGEAREIIKQIMRDK